jgi:hypothetical protein
MALIGSYPPEGGIGLILFPRFCGIRVGLIQKIVSVFRVIFDDVLKPRKIKGSQPGIC